MMILVSRQPSKLPMPKFVWNDTVAIYAHGKSEARAILRRHLASMKQSCDRIRLERVG